MLYEFLISHREEIIADTQKKTVGISEDRPTSPASESGLPQFYDHLIEVLKRLAEGRPKSPMGHAANGGLSTALHGKELSRLGYTISQVVHGYGVLCQAITERAAHDRVSITAVEFSALNLSLDHAIAEAVTAFTLHAGHESADAATQMGFLVHELRNALAAASIAHAMVKKGIVGTGGSTNALLERNLRRMRDILDRSFSLVRLRNEKAPVLLPTLLIEIVEEVEATASEEARSRGLLLKVDVNHRLRADVDRNDLISALSNLVQNAIKYTTAGGVVKIRSRVTDSNVVLEVEDQCGGLPPGKAEDLFRAYSQKGANRTGLGLGLTISRQAVERNGGTLEARNHPQKGCVFAIALPKRRRPHAPARRHHGALHGARHAMR